MKSGNLDLLVFTHVLLSTKQLMPLTLSNEHIRSPAYYNFKWWESYFLCVYMSYAAAFDYFFGFLKYLKRQVLLVLTSGNGKFMDIRWSSYVLREYNYNTTLKVYNLNSFKKFYALLFISETHSAA